MLKVRWAPLAQDDLGQIDDHYMSVAPASSMEINDRIIAAARFLAETPFAGPAIGDRDRRKWRVRRTPYILVYRVADAHLLILRVFHTARDPNAR